MQIPARKFGAQERYAQSILDFLWENEAKALETTLDGGTFYRGSIHMLVRKVEPKAQAGDVVNILRESGAITQVAHGIWMIARKEVFFDENGEPIGLEQTFGRDTKERIMDQQVADLAKRIDSLEAKVESLTAIVVVLGGKDAEVPPSISEKPEI